MHSLEEIQNKKDIISSLESIAYVYQQQALDRMETLRQEVLETRSFLGGVAKIYNRAKGTYLSSLRGGEEEFKKASFIQRNGRQVVVFLSANERFYGAIILDLWSEVKEWFKEHECDLVVVGSVGKRLARSDGLVDDINYFDLDDKEPEKGQISRILDFISNYEQILVYHGSFETIFSQTTERENISGGVTLKEAPGKEANKYLFEPSPEEILKFFETEIIQALFKQSILEHQLGRSASRLMAMSSAHEKSEKKILNFQQEKRRLQRRIKNKKQLEAIARSQFVPESKF